MLIASYTTYQVIGIYGEFSVRLFPQPNGGSASIQIFILVTGHK